MGRIASTFKRLGKINEAALVPRVLVGYPSLEITRQLVPIMARQGADLIELEIPSEDRGGQSQADPRSLEQSVTIADCLSIAAEARRANEIPLLFRSHYDPIREYDPCTFAAHCASSGVDGLIVPDLPLEQTGGFKSACQSADIDLIFQVAPAIINKQWERMAEAASGFIYCTFILTGVRLELEPDAPQFIERVRQFTNLPLVLDSGITTPQQVAQLAQYADGVAVASAITSVMRGLLGDEVILGVADLVRELKEATVKGIDGVRLNS